MSSLIEICSLFLEKMSDYRQQKNVDLTESSFVPTAHYKQISKI